LHAIAVADTLSTTVMCAPAMARVYGTGGLRLRTSKRHPDGEYWLRYHVAGRPRTENAHFCECHHKRAQARAERLLAQRIGEAAAGLLPSPRAQRTLVEDLAEAMFKARRVDLFRKIPESLPTPTREWRKARAEKVLKETRARWNNHLAPVLSHRKAVLVTKQDLDEYIAARLDAGARNSTVNREMEMLRHAYRLGYEQRPRLVTDVPPFPAPLPEAARAGYIEDKAFNKLLGAIPDAGLRAMVMCAYRLGFRKAELQNLLVMQLADGWLRLFKGATKNGKARSVKLPDDIQVVVARCAKGKAPEAYLFTWSNGDQILDFRAAWKKATAAAGVPSLMFHDLRRSAVRRGLRRGVPVPALMKVTGHLTRQIFDEYDVTGESDLAEAAKVL